jgi:hyperosmotically inducible protein
MMTRRVFFASFGLSVALLAGPKTPLTDDMIADSVKLKLAHDVVVKGGGFQIDVKDGVVTLKGKVEHEQQKTKAEKLARKVQGVKSVDNQLVVTPIR